MWKKSEVWKNRKFQIVLFLEIVLLCIGVMGLFAKEYTIFDERSMNIHINGGFYEENVGYYVDGASVTANEWLVANGFSLNPGSYELVLDYEVLENEVVSMGIMAEQASYKSLLANTTAVYSGINKQTLQFYVTEQITEEDNLRIVVNYMGTQPLTVRGIEIVKTNAASSMFVICVLGISLLLNWLVMLYVYMGKYTISIEQKLVWFGIPIVTILASLPVFVDYILSGADSIYHILRIEFLANSIKDGIIPVRIAPDWIYGHGYASSVFYCDTFLLLPAVLRIAGFPMITAYNVFLVAVNLSTAIISYVSFKGMFQNNKYIGLFGSMLYTLAPYRIYNIYNRSAVGEYTAMTFLPLICYGLYLLLAEDTEKESYKKNWIILTLGMSGVIQSHVLSCEIVAVFIVLLCVLSFKRVFRKVTFVQMIKAVIGTILLNLWFLVPFLDMMSSAEYKFSQNEGMHIQNRGILPANIFYTMQNAGANSRFHEYGMVDTEPIGIGIAIMLATATYLVLRKNYKKEDRKTDCIGMVAFVIGVIAILITTCYFPWDNIQTWNAITGTLIPLIQFPTRLTIIPTVCMVVVGCVAAVWMLQKDNHIEKGLFFGVIVCCCIFFSMYQTNDTLDIKTGMYKLYSAEAMGHSAILGGEYLPLEASACNEYHGAWTSENVTVGEYQKENLEVVAAVSVAEGNTSNWIELPMTYYKGYHATDINTGDVFEVEYGTNGHVRVPLSEGYEGTLRVWYNGMWYWRVAEGISLLFGIAVVYMLCRNSKQKILQHL